MATMKLRAQSRSIPWKARRFQLAVEALEARVVPCTDELGVGDHASAEGDPDVGTFPAVVAPQPTTTTGGANTTTTAATGLPVPILNSLAGAPSTLYLNFTGDF